MHCTIAPVPGDDEDEDATLLRPAPHALRSSAREGSAAIPRSGASAGSARSRCSGLTLA
ncbi:hypothetical protein [Clavibacter sp. CFBP 8614]|uniref:hypothetical protein n=1 Tax=unclassified Clavibacter TaxID=2626594 RepID=UPI0040411EF3